MNYLIADSIIRIKNAALARRRSVILPYSKFVREITKVLVKEGFLVEVQEELVEKRKHLLARIAYDKKFPVVTDVAILSKPSLRKYASAHNQTELQGKGLGVIVVSTSKGIMTGKEAFKKGIGGELLFKIW